MITVETVVNTWDEAPRNQDDDAKIIKLVAKGSYFRGVIGNQVVSGTDAQTEHRRPEETGEYDEIRPRKSILFENENKNGNEEEEESPCEMRVNIDTLIVKREET